MSARRKQAPAATVPPHAQLPEPFAGWFASRGWHPRAHQLALLDTVREGRDTLLMPDGVHFKPEGSELLGKAVAAFIRPYLGT